MTRSMRGFKALAACGLVAGLVVLATGTGQAESGAYWMVNGTKISGTLLPEMQITGIVGGQMSLLGSAGGASVEILCTGAKFTGAKLETEGTISAGNKVRFTGCLTKIKGSVVPACQPSSEGEGGVVVSQSLKGLLGLSEGQTVIKFTPVSGTAFVIFNFGEECSLGESVPVTGTSAVRDSNGAFKTDQVTHQVEQAPASSKLIFCGNAASVDGSASLALAGAHAGLTWSAWPG